MLLLSFDPLRTFDVPGASYLKPAQWLAEKPRILAADWVLFAPSWLVNTVAYALHKRVFPSLPSYHLGYDKVQMTRAFQALVPAHVPATVIARADDAGVAQVMETLAFPLVVKHPRDSMGHGVTLVEDLRALRGLLPQSEVLYAQECLPIDRDLRVVWVGEEIVTAYWRIGGSDGFHHNIARGAEVSFDAIPPAALELVRYLGRELRIDHAGFDIAMVGEHPYLFEFNLLFGNDALNRAGIRIGPHIHRYLARHA
jgi:ribosomal protein S6--L-glutamate ligase